MNVLYTGREKNKGTFFLVSVAHLLAATGINERSEMEGHLPQPACDSHKSWSFAVVVVSNDHRRILVIAVPSS